MIQTSTFRQAAVLALAILTSTSLLAQTDQDTVRWDERAGQWVYTLFNPADTSRSKEVRYTPRTLIEPVIKSSVRWDKDRFEYRYRIANGGNAVQPISSVSVQTPKWDAAPPQRSEPVQGESHAEALANARSEMAADKDFVAKNIHSPQRWNPFLNVNRPTRVVFGWLVNYEGYTGIAPRASQGGFSALRTELPGAGWIELQGDTPDIYNAATLPRVGAVAEHVAQVLAEDLVYVAALVPAIVVPNPYDGAELARRIKAHVLTWTASGLVDAATETSLTPKLDNLIAAATAGNKKVVRAVTVEIMTEVFKQHPDMTHLHTDDDEDGHDRKAERRKVLTALGELADVTEPSPPLNRVAARALVFNMRYLLARM